MKFVAIKLTNGKGVWINRDKIQSIEHLPEGCRIWVECGSVELEKFDSVHDGSIVASMLNATKD